MDADLKEQLKPGARVTVTQQIAARNHTWTTAVKGTVQSFQQKPTGSWFAHSRGDKLWLDRLVLKLDNGEITTLNLDDYTHVELEPGAGPVDESKNESDLPA